MTLYGGITFTVKAPGGLRPLWGRESSYVRTHLPYSNVDDVQWDGLGNAMITLTAQFATFADIVLMTALVGPVARPITGLMGENVAAARLLSVRPLQGNTVDDYFEAELTFDQGGS